MRLYLPWPQVLPSTAQLWPFAQNIKRAKGALPQDFATTIPSAWNALLGVIQQTE